MATDCQGYIKTIGSRQGDTLLIRSCIFFSKMLFRKHLSAIAIAALLTFTTRANADGERPRYIVYSNVELHYSLKGYPSISYPEASQW